MDIEEKKRREFVKKILYKAPVITLMGSLSRPSRLSAETSIPDPPLGATSTNSANSANSGASDPFKSKFSN
ncbi:hypothetical protein MNB_SV-6-601 [hydrothermal vent metagenome]|uniref:Uncharacterized protein n=1 Tax=hydrothermal vent metagenome TaxID=652676 RepID=A0A1W1CBV6_9ZZZZ